MVTMLVITTVQQSDYLVAVIVIAIVTDVSRDSFRMPPYPLPNDEKPLDKGSSTTDSGVVTSDIKMNTMVGKKYQPESNVCVDSAAL